MAEQDSFVWVFIGDPDVSEAVYRLLKASREGRKAQEEVRVAGLKGKDSIWLRLRVRPLGRGRDSKLTVWAVTDVTRDRELAYQATDAQGVVLGAEVLRALNLMAAPTAKVRIRAAGRAAAGPGFRRAIDRAGRYPGHRPHAQQPA